VVKETSSTGFPARFSVAEELKDDPDYQASEFSQIGMCAFAHHLTSI
jgi:hypothetical protein